MPLKVINEGDLLRLQPSGALSRQCLAFALGEVIAEEHRMPWVLNRVTDLTLVESFDLSYETIWALAEARRTAGFKNPFRSAIVAKRPIERGFALMFKTLNDNPQIEIQLFPNLEDAMAWARLNRASALDGTQASL